jgi:hypothetical protein
MKIYSYVVVHDKGFAPNPFHGWCTLACCKPVIRRTIGRNYNPKEDYWIVGLSPKATGNRLIYAMHLTEIPLLYNAYFHGKRFEMKKPNSKSGKVGEYGDNIYRLKRDGSFEQRPSVVHGKKYAKRDFSGKYVLVSNEFYYFGADSRDLKEYPAALQALKVERGHRCNFGENVKDAFREAIRSFRREAKDKKKLFAQPSGWRDVDDSWRRCGA